MRMTNKTKLQKIDLISDIVEISILIMSVLAAGFGIVILRHIIVSLSFILLSLIVYKLYFIIMPQLKHIADSDIGFLTYVTKHKNNPTNIKIYTHILFQSLLSSVYGIEFGRLLISEDFYFNLLQALFIILNALVVMKLIDAFLFINDINRRLKGENNDEI